MTLSPNPAPDFAPRFETRVERALARPVPLWLVLLILLVGAAATIGFGAIVLDAPASGRLGAVAVRIAAIPDTIGKLLPGSGIAYFRGDYSLLPPGLAVPAGHPFVDPGYVLVTVYDPRRGRPVVRLVRLADGQVLRDVAPDVDAVNARTKMRSPLVDLKRDRTASRNRLMHPLPMPDGGVIVHDSSPLARFDACGRLVWMIDGIFHHAVERGPDGNLWAAYRYPVPREPRVGPTFHDEAIAEISPDGQVLRLERIADILDRNGMGQLWRGRPYSDDPFHLNDIQPVPASGPYWRRGDVFVSLRNLSLVLLYRPSTGRVLWSRGGPWAFQHDVSVLDDHRITLFDNHWRVAFPEGEIDGHNRVPVYDFATGRATFPYAAATGRVAIRTREQGRATPLANGDVMLEETERGRLIRISPAGVLRWRYIAADAAMRRMPLRWSRYLDPVSDGPAIQAMTKATCS